MKIGLVGYGKMGRLIRTQAIAKNLAVPVIVDPTNSAPEVTDSDFGFDPEQVDVIIDFTIPRVVIDNIRRYGEMKIPAVIGTTGWYEEMEQVRAIVEHSGIGLIWSGNFSLGVHLYLHLIKAAGQIINRFAQYDVAVHEYHHRHKADSPSGTARMIGDLLIETMDRKETTVTARLDYPIGESELHLSSTRGGSIPGTHQVIFDSDEDTIILEHSARNRHGFAAGALLAAEWICGKSGLYTIDDLMQSVIGGGDN